MHRCFLDIKLEVGNDFEILGEDYNHMANALRMKIGEEFELVSLDGVFLCKILEISKKKIIARAEEEIEDRSESKIKLVVYQALAKGDKLDLVVQKATELGAHQIVIFDSLRSVVKLDSKKAEKRLEKLSTIAKAAACQSRRSHIPEILFLGDLKEIDEENLLVFYEDQDKVNLKESLCEIKSQRLAMLVGPEGGLDPSEIKILKDKGAKIIGLGPRILRTETCSIAGLSILQYELGDIGGKFESWNFNFRL